LKLNGGRKKKKKNESKKAGILRGVDRIEEEEREAKDEKSNKGAEEGVLIKGPCVGRRERKTEALAAMRKRDDTRPEGWVSARCVSG